MSFQRLILSIPIFVLFFCSCSNEIKEIVPEQKKDFCSLIHFGDTVTLDKELQPLQDSMKEKTGVYVLEEGDASMVARAWLTEHAQKSIDVQYFIFSTDNVGLIACDYLVRAADRGVKVRILIDDIMVDAGPHDILTLDGHPNIEIKIYNPGTNLGKNIFQKIKKLNTDFRGANQRMHNKTFTVDDKVVITGGRNIADEYFDYDHEFNFRDRDVLLLGKACKTIKASFEQFWNSSISVPVSSIVNDPVSVQTNSKSFDRLHQYACNPDNFWPQVREKISQIPSAFKDIQLSGNLVWVDTVNFVADIPGKNDGNEKLAGGGITTAELIKLVMNAKKQIDIQSPYLITTDLGRNLFKNAVKRGVKIRILTNSLASNDNIEAFSGYKRDRNKLLETGVRVFEFKPDAAIRYKRMTGALQKKMDYKPVFGLHAKSMVIDGKITVIGTFNLDPRSANLNCECISIIHSAKVAASVLAGMEEELKPENAWEITKTFNPDSTAGFKRNLKAMTRRVVPKDIL